MKDEELFKAWKSEQYKDQSTEEKMEFVEHLHTFPKHFENAFLAGLKAGRPQWHFVSKEGHPSKDDIYLIIRNDGLHLGDYCCEGDGDIDCQSWCDYPSEEEIQDDSVIAWKEIVLPKESE